MGVKGRRKPAKPPKGKRPAQPASTGVEVDPLRLPDPAPVDIPPVAAEPVSVGVTRAVAAAALGVPPNRINQWVNDGAPVLQRGRRGEAALYDVEALRTWKSQRVQDNAGSLSLEREKALLARAQREKLELEAQVRAGQLVERDDVIAETRAGVHAVRTRLLQLPRQLGQAGIITRDREPEVTALVNEALRELEVWKWARAEPAAELGLDLDEDADE